MFNYQFRGWKQGCRVSMTDTNPDATCEISIILYNASKCIVSSTVNAIMATMNEQIRPMAILSTSAVLRERLAAYSRVRKVSNRPASTRTIANARSFIDFGPIVV